MHTTRLPTVRALVDTRRQYQLGVAPQVNKFEHVSNWWLPDVTSREVQGVPRLISGQWGPMDIYMYHG